MCSMCSCTAATCFARWSFRENLFWHMSHCQFLRFSFLTLPFFPTIGCMFCTAIPVSESANDAPLYLYSHCSVAGTNPFLWPFFPNDNLRLNFMNSVYVMLKGCH